MAFMCKPPASGLFIDNGLDPVAIRINYESGEIIRTVFGMKAHASVVLSAVGQRRLVESDRCLLRRGSKSQMEALAGRDNSWLTKADGKLILSSGAPVADRRFFAASTALLSEGADVAKRSEGGVIKDGRPCEVSHRERKVMQHKQKRGKRLTRTK